MKRIFAVLLCAALLLVGALSAVIFCRLNSALPHYTFDPDEIGKITIRSCVGGLYEYDVEGTELEELIAYLNESAVTNRETVKPAGGWSYAVSVYAPDGVYVTAYTMDADWIQIENTRYYSEGYFQPLIDLVTEKGTLLEEFE